MVLLGFSAAAIHQAYGISGFAGLSTAGVFPLLASITMLLSAGLILWRTLRAPPPPPKAGGFAGRILPLRVLGYMGLVVAYGVGIGFFGFVVASGLFLLVSLLWLAGMPWHRALTASAGALLIIVLVFRYGFQVILP